MTEREWLLSADPAPMLYHVRDTIGQRKFRLFAVACCRLVWHLLDYPECHRAIEVAEGYADGFAGDSDLAEARHAVALAAYRMAETAPSQNRRSAYDSTAASLSAYNAVLGATWDIDYGGGTGGGGSAYPAAGKAAREGANAVRQAMSAVGGDWEEVGHDELVAQADIALCIFGNPFRSVSSNPEWRTSTAVAIARHMYESRDFSAMPILADALQDAGCDSDDILNHCREADGVHVRGCWVVDLILGKS